MNPADENDSAAVLSSDRIHSEPPPPPTGTKKAREENDKLRLTQLKNERYLQQSTHIQAEHDARLSLLDNLYHMIQGWLLFVGFLLLLQGFLGIPKDQKFFISDNVLLAVLGVTTVNVLAAFLVAAKYVFPKDPKWMDATHSPSKPRAARNPAARVASAADDDEA